MSGFTCDPEMVGNSGRMSNHSCDPNCMLEVVRLTNSLDWNISEARGAYCLAVVADWIHDHE